MGDYGKAKANLPFPSNNIVNSYVGLDGHLCLQPYMHSIFSMSDLRAIAIVSCSVK